MKILAFAYACEPDKGSEPGAGWCWVRILAGLGEVWVITRANNRQSIERGIQEIPEKDNLHFIYVDPPQFLTFWKKGQRGVRLFYFVWQTFAARRGIRLAKEVEFDFVWHLTLANAWLGSLAFLVGPPLIYGPVGGGVACPLRLRSSLGLRGNVYESLRAVARALCRYANPVARMSWRRATVILAQNPETIRWLPRRHRAKAKVFPHAVLQDPSDCAQDCVRKESNIALFAGRLIPWKGIELAIRTLVMAPAWRLQVCGSGPDRRRLEALAEKLGVASRTDFVGQVPRDELLRRMREDCDVLLFPSFHDDAPLTVVEALASGLPVITLAVGGPPILAGGAALAISPFQSKTAIVRSIANGLNSGTYPSRSEAGQRGRLFTVESRRKSLVSEMGFNTGPDEILTSPFNRFPDDSEERQDYQSGTKGDSMGSLTSRFGLRQVVEIHGGAKARIQLTCLYFAGFVAQNFGFRGMQSFAWNLGKRFKDNHSVDLELGNGSRLRIYLSDGYWIKLLFSRFEYEPELSLVLSTLLSEPEVSFIDCGANIGYWSAVAAQWVSRPECILALEASPRSFNRLRENAQLNQEAFTCRLKAVWSTDNVQLDIVSHEQRHAGSSVVNRRERIGQEGYETFQIDSVTLDSACAQLMEQGLSRFVLKLDLEDAELPALLGAKRVMALKPLVIYEDHGGSIGNGVGAYLANELGMDLYYCHPSGQPIKIDGLKEVRAIKTESASGYNFIACAPDSHFSPMVKGLGS